MAETNKRAPQVYNPFKLLYAFFHYLKLYGARTTLVRVLRFGAKILEKKAGQTMRIHVMASPQDVIAADYVAKPYKRPLPFPKTKKMSIGWVLSPLSYGAGGQNTIFRFVRYLQSAGHKNTIYLYEGIMPQQLKEAKEIMNKGFKTDVPIKKLKDITNDHHVLMATGWETAYPVFNIPTKAHKCYFVQDYEPYFYGIGSKSVLAENTYRFGFYGVTAGPWLTKKLSREFGMDCGYFDFGSDHDIYRVTGDKPRKKVCFYARPVTERRAFELGVLILQIFHQMHPDYEIDLFGWDVGNFKLPFPFNNRTILSHEELAELYNESVACLILSLTNASLLPLEVLSAGCTPVLNDGDNNRLIVGDNKFVKYAPSVPQELATALSEAVKTHTPRVADQMSKSVSGRSWEDAYAKVEKLLLDEISR